jgi:hypothetical protein
MLRLLSILMILLGFVNHSVCADKLIDQPAPISAEEATRAAARYLANKKLDVSRHYVLSARYVQTGPWTDSSHGKGPYWQITYELPRADGGQYFVLVYLNGTIRHFEGR